MQATGSYTTSVQFMRVERSVLSCVDKKTGKKYKALGLCLISKDLKGQLDKVEAIMKNAEFAVMEFENINGISYWKKLDLHQHWDEVIAEHDITEFAIKEGEEYNVMEGDIDYSSLDDNLYLSLCEKHLL